MFFVNLYLQELEETTKNLEVELEQAQAALEKDESINFGKLASKPSKVEAEQDMEVSKSALLEKLEIKKQELVCCFILIQYCLSSFTFFPLTPHFRTVVADKISLFF